MRYPDSRQVRLGDRVRLSNGERGTVVFSIDTDEYSADFCKAGWSYLNKGVMITTDMGALVHYDDLNLKEFVLVTG